jgi:hypothetical protein
MKRKQPTPPIPLSLSTEDVRNPTSKQQINTLTELIIEEEILWYFPHFTSRADQCRAMVSIATEILRTTYGMQSLDQTNSTLCINFAVLLTKMDAGGEKRQEVLGVMRESIEALLERSSGRGIAEMEEASGMDYVG